MDLIYYTCHGIFYAVSAMFINYVIHGPDLPTTTKKSYLLQSGIQNTSVWNLVTTGLYFTKNSYFSHNCQLHTFFWVSTPCLAIRVHSEQIFQHEIKDHNAIVNFVPLLGPPSWLFSGALFSCETYASLLVNLYNDYNWFIFLFF